MMFTYPQPVIDAIRYFVGEPDETRVERAEVRCRQLEETAERDYETICDWLPEQCGAFLDVGCGLGALALRVGIHYWRAAVNVIDGSEQLDHRKGGYHGGGLQAYRDRRLAVQLIEANLPSDRVVADYGPDPDLTIPVDLIVSTKSWGHHYPVETYLGLALRSLRPGGRIIVDLRRNRGGEAVMTGAGFVRLAKVYETPKCERIVFGF